MSQAFKDIETPLGQERRATKRGVGAFAPGLRMIGSTAAILVVLAVSGLIAARDKQIRDPARLAVSTPEVVAPVAAAEEPAGAPAEKIAAAEPKSQAPSSEGASIIHVNPEDAGKGSGVVIIRDPSAIGQNLRVAHLPDRALIEQTDIGPLPIRAADGRRPFDVYARPWSGSRGARVAIVIGGLALSQTGTQTAIGKLPAEVTLAFAPDGNSVGRWMQDARKRGHEIVMQLPLEPFDYPNVNPGRNTLTVGVSAE